MVGAYISFISMKFGLPWWLAVIISIVACAVLGVVMEKVAYKPLRNASRISLLITAIGISYLLQNLFQLIFGANPQPYTCVYYFTSVKSWWYFNSGKLLY